MQYIVADVLSHFDIDIRNADGKTLTVLCPFHDDTRPSGKIDLTNGYYNCFSCNRHTTVLNYLAAKLKRPIQDIYFEVGGLDSTPSKYKEQDPSDVQEWHVALFKCPELLAELYARKVTDETIRLHRLGAFVPGEGPAAIRIPIRSKRGAVVAVKDYRPGALEGKFTWPKVASNRSNKEENTRHLLFPADQLAYPYIVICGGEIKAIAAAAVLNSYDIGAISGTGSESIPFTTEQLNAFKGKIVYVCYDIDTTGKEFALKLCRSLSGIADAVHLIDLPLDPVQFPHGDVNDFLAINGDLVALVKSTPIWTYIPPTFEAVSHIKEGDEPEEVTLNRAVNASMAKRKVKLEVVVSSMDQRPFSIPKEIRVVCDRSHTYCPNCQIHEEFSTEIADVTLSGERIEIIEMVDQELVKQERILKKAFGIPQRCSTVTFFPRTFYNVEDVRVSQPLNITSRTNERSMQAAYCVGEGRIELNEGYTMIGRMYPHPTTQQATLLITQFETVQDALSTYVPTDLESLKIFNPNSWTLEGISEKLDEIYRDLSYNVTLIYGRQDLHLLYDLSYHSVLLLPKRLKGWVEVLVVGDSAQGKSLCADRLINHYGLGERVVCKGATVAGLLGGVQQHGQRWFASWGKIPIHDRRLVVLDEVKGTSPIVVAGLTDMRSSGIAELTKIEKRRTNARTRLIWISNPRSERVISEYNTGVEAIRELIGSPEDVRRFDAIMVVAQKEVADELIHSANKPTVKHKYTDSLCRELILFGWTVPNVEFEDPNYLGTSAISMTSNYVEDVPIVDSGTMSEKLMRLSTALAVRTFSIKDSSTVFVRNCHIDYILQFLNRCYASKAFGYLEYSQKRLSSEKLIEPEAVKHRILNKTPFPHALVHALLISDEIDSNLIADVFGWPQEEARNLLAFFNRHHALKRTGRTYRKTAGFSRLLQDLEQRDVRGRPEYIPDIEEEF